MSSTEVEKPKELPCRLLFRSAAGCIENLFGRTIFLEFPNTENKKFVKICVIRGKIESEADVSGVVPERLPPFYTSA